jgi:hypothetical protein
MDILAPRLRRLLAHFMWGLECSQPCIWDRFQQPEEDWFCGFAKLAMECKIPLCLIEIEFEPLQIFREHLLEIQNLKFPYHRMERVKSTIRPLGVKLAYSKANITEKRFWKEISRLRGEEDASVGSELEGDEEKENYEESSSISF